VVLLSGIKFSRDFLLSERCQCSFQIEEDLTHDGHRYPALLRSGISVTMMARAWSPAPFMAIRPAPACLRLRQRRPADWLRLPVSRRRDYRLTDLNVPVRRRVRHSGSQSAAAMFENVHLR